MMNTKLVATVAGLFLMAAGAIAQDNTAMRVPAELPPEDYKGKQYVDSNGCVFIRAGIDGSTTWIPRVSADRQVVCGMEPSLPQQTVEAAAPAPRVMPAKQPVPAPLPVRRTRPKTAIIVEPTVVLAPPPEERLIPRHLVDDRANMNNLRAPLGYKFVWTDGRMNPHRAEQTQSGIDAMNRVWRETVPRRLIDPEVGQRSPSSLDMVPVDRIPAPAVVTRNQHGVAALAPLLGARRAEAPRPGER